MLYEDLVREFRWNVPPRFNFAADVVDCYAVDRGRVAIYAADRGGRPVRYTFSDVSEASSRLANALRALGVRPGTRVLVALPASPEWAMSIVAALRCGAVLVPCRPDVDADDLAEIARKSASGAFVVTARLAASGDALRDACPAPAIFVSVGAKRTGWRSFDETMSGGSKTRDAEPAPVADPAFLFHTREPSGELVGIVHGHGFAYVQRFPALYWTDLRRTDLHFSTFDTASIHGMTQLLGPWSVGVPVVLVGRQPIADVLEEFGVTTFCAAPADYETLLVDGALANEPRTVRHCTSTGRPLAPAITEAWQGRTGLFIHEAYGQTEVAPLVANTKGLPVRPGSIGKPVPGHEVVVVDEEGTEVGTGEVGEIALRGRSPALFLGYDGLSTRDARRRGGLYRTGDRARRDEQGYLWLPHLDTAKTRT
jgi:acyl-coenzyme A synthetase/AMP-(fatty) acid ligase